MVPARCTQNQAWLPDFFNDFFDNTWMDRTRATAPAINVVENENSYDLELAAPGMTKEDFSVTLDKDGDLVIKMEKKDEKKEEGHFLRREFNYTRFQQTMLLPEDAVRENISAKVENGILTVNIPKVEKVKAEDKNRAIEIA